MHVRSQFFFVTGGKPKKAPHKGVFKGGGVQGVRTSGLAEPFQIFFEK